ncbi:VWA domain-containing protein [Devosia sp. Root635]|uniref:VWA domain-containing protein n=1 Tax=Devosia sp. Root635 TaxID=1736575 RepID=UPI0006FBFFDD|nr:VWA domain-containing protein [Devosia sp. Root635]KRA47422.1 hypothetical protein ASD80_17635 [Devosia sp. Root635]
MLRSLLLAMPLVLVGAALAGAQPLPTGIIDLGDAVVTGFSGTVAPDPLTLPDGVDLIDETLIDLDGIAARIIGLGGPGYVWDARASVAPELRLVLAREVGQIFGVTLDDAEYPNIYLTATSAYGLPIVADDADDDGRPERLLEGEAGARFMDGLWGPSGGPGSIWKVDGVTGEVTLFADVTLDGAANPGAALGNIAYDAAHAQLFVSDRATGMIHRFGLDGVDLERFDHGVAGRSAAGLPPVPYDPAAALDISRGDFDTEDPDSWGYADADRQVWGLAVHDGRLYYAVLDDSQVWSVGIDIETGAFAADPRWELDVPKRPSKLPVSDIVFTELGAMILAQRGDITATYDYTGFAETDAARTYRYWLENPDDPATPSRWIEEPEEYAIGFGGDNRRTEGGVDIGYGYDSNGLLDLTYCEASLLSTADDLRQDDDLADQLLPGGPLAIDGLQIAPAGPVRPENTPPWFSYMLDLAPLPGTTEVGGHEGDVAVYRRGCGAPPYIGTYGGAGYETDPPYVSYPEDPDNPDTPDEPDNPEDPTCIGEACALPEFDILKTCQACAINPETGLPRCQCLITVTSNGVPFTGDLVVDEQMMFGSNPASQTVISLGSADPWTCTQPPFAPADPAQCKIDWQTLSALGNSSSIAVEIELPDQGAAVDATNCALLTLGDDEVGYSCTDLVNEDLQDIDMRLDKTWEPGAVAGAGTFVLTVGNVGDAFDATAALSVTDTIPAGITVTTASDTDWTCAPIPATGPASITCQFTGTGSMASGATSEIRLDATLDEAGIFENCATVAVLPESGLADSYGLNDEGCVTVVEDDDDFDIPDDEPEYDPSCGTNVIFVVDESRSIADANATYYVNNALTNAASIFNSNGAQAAVIRFSDNAVVSYPMGSGTFPLVTNGYNPAAGGGTNWEAALLAANSLLPSPNTIIVFITDGTPTAYLDGSGNVAYTTNSVLATNEAIAAVNLIYGQGTPIVGIGIGSVSTHLDALLGTSSLSSSYGALDADLTTLARNACADLYLTKTINPGYVDFHYISGDVIATVTLAVTNTSASALTNVTVEDELPVDLTNPAAFSQPATVSGSTVSWTIPSIAAGATATLSFQTTLVPNPAPTPNWRCLANYAQVTASDSALNSVPGNMASALLGPVHEHDEASASLCVRDKEPVTPPDCGASYLWVTKKTDFPEVCVPGGSPACSFTITVRAQCKDFNGPVLFGDGVSNAGTGVAAPISAISNTAVPTICAWPADWSGTSTPSECLANLSLPVNQSITFSVTLDEPIPAGSGYRNCFVADGKPVLPADYAGALADVNPTTAPTGGVWGNCAPFSVAGPPLPIPRPPQPDDKRTISCNAPAQPSADGTVCICPRGTRAQGSQCVAIDQPPVRPAPIQCNPPAVPNAAGTACVCPQGTIPLGTRCITPELPDILLPKAEPEPRREPRHEPAAPAPKPAPILIFPKLPGGLFGG